MTRLPPQLALVTHDVAGFGVTIADAWDRCVRDAITGPYTMYGVRYHTFVDAMHTTTLSLPADLQRRLREHARRAGSPQAAVVRAALQRYLEDAPRPALTSVGAGDDGELEAPDARAWVRARWALTIVCDDDIARVRRLVARDADLPLGIADASVVACAERHGGRVATLDRRFGVVEREGRLSVLPTP